MPLSFHLLNRPNPALPSDPEQKRLACESPSSPTSMVIGFSHCNHPAQKADLQAPWLPNVEFFHDSPFKKGRRSETLTRSRS